MKKRTFLRLGRFIRPYGFQFVLLMLLLLTVPPMMWLMIQLIILAFLLDAAGAEHSNTH